MGHNSPVPVSRPLAAGLALVFTLASTPAFAQIRINEILPNPTGTDTGTNELVEVYNAGSTAVDMTGWAIDDAVTIGQVATRARIPEDLDASCSTNPVIQPGEFRIIHGQAAAAYLNNTGDDVYLVSSRVLNPTVIDHVNFGPPPSEGAVWAALPNGTTNFAWRTNTMCATNGSLGDVIAPGTIADLTAVPGLFPGEVVLHWTAPGDDGASGTAINYVIRVAHAPIDALNFDAAADLDHWRMEPQPSPGGVAESFTVFGLAPDSTWYFAIKAQDEVPNTGAVSNSPGTLPHSGSLLNPDLGYNTYFGNLHSHTSYSDGVQTPPQAYSFARTGAPTPLDFLAVTDHNHVSAGMQLPNYALGMAAAASANDDGNFVAIWGQEWGIIASGGHANVFEAPVLFGWDPGQYDVFVAEADYTGLYTAYLANPPATYPPVVEWCHPSTGDFNSYAVTANGKSTVHLMALISGPAFSTSITESDAGSTTGNEALFQDALRKGYRVSPTGDQDNHNATWGASSQTRTAVLAAGRTKSEILAALAAGRNYGTQDHNTIVRLSADGHPMGSAFTAAQGVRISASVTDPDVGETISRIDLLRGITGSSNAVVVASNIGSGAFQWREEQTFTAGTEAHYFLRILMSNSANIWTGPVYVTYDPNAQAAVEAPSPGTLAFAVGPNPSHGRSTATFALPQSESHATLAVYDAGGRHVATLLDGPLAAGVHQVAWSGGDDLGRSSPVGVYFLRLVTSRQTAVRKLLVLR